jgi:mycofactocin precursor
MSPADTIEKLDHEALDASSAAAEIGDLDGNDLDDVEESLVEEISIDGMCGVY